MRWTIMALAVAGAFMLEIATVKIPAGRLSAKKPVVFAGQQLMTGDNGDLEIAVDTNKNYVIYKRDCQRYDVVPEDSQDHKNCERDRKEDERNPRQGCGRCEIAGWIRGGVFYANDAAGVAGPNGGGANGGPNAGPSAGAVAKGGGFFKSPWPYLIGGGATAATVAAVTGGNSSAAQGPQFTSITNRRYAFSLTGDNGCLGFLPAANTTFQLNVDANTGLGTASHQHMGALLNYNVTEARRSGDNIELVANGTISFPPSASFPAGRAFTHRATLEISGASAQAAQIAEVFSQTNPTPPCAQTYRGPGTAQ